MEGPTRDFLARMPLAEAVLTLWRWVADSTVLDQAFNEHRGRSYEKILTFPFLVYLVRDALLEFNGSGRRTIEKAEEAGQLETSFRASMASCSGFPSPSVWLCWPIVRPGYERSIPRPLRPRLRCPKA